MPVGLSIDRNALGQFLTAAQKAANIKVNVETDEAAASIVALRERLAALSQLVADIPIGADDTKALATAAGLQGKIAILAESMSDLQLNANSTALTAKIAQLQAQQAHLATSLGNMEADVDINAALAQLASLKAQEELLTKDAENIRLGISTTGLASAETQLLGLEAAAKALNTNLQLKVTANTVAAAADVTALQAKADALSKDLADMRLGVTDVAAEATIAKLQAQILALTSKLNDVKVGVDVVGLAQADAQLLAMQAAIKGLSSSENDGAAAAKTLFGAWGQLPPSLAAISAAQRDAESSGNGLWGVWGLLNTRISLFGGTLGNFLPGLVTWVHAWHVAADGVLEFVAVWTPAAVGIAAFAAAASQGVLTLQTHITNMLSVVNSTAGTVSKIFPLTGGFLAMQNAVQPAVYELWGDAISVASSKSGVLLTLVQKLVPVIEQLGARTTAALESGGLEVFTKNSVQDIQGLGTAFGNFFGIIGNLIKVVPGYAAVLLSLGTSFLGILEHVTAAIAPVLQIALAIHGFILYTGLAVTGLLALENGLQKMGAAVLSGITDLVGWAVATQAAAGATGVFDTALALFAAVNPFVWIAVAVAAIGGLVYILKNAKSATQDWGDAMQTSIKNATSLSQGISLVTTGQTDVTQKLTQAQAQLSDSTQKYTEVATGHGGVVRGVTQAYQDQVTKVQQLQAIQTQLSSEAQLYDTRLSDLSKQYGGTSNAVALLNAAGITNSQIFDKSASTWQQIQIQVQGAENGIKSLANTTGILGNELQALDRQTTASNGADVASIQKVTTAMDALISATTDTQGTFDTYGEGLDTLNSSSATFTDHLGSLEVKGTTTKVAIDSLTQAGLNLNQAFTDQVTNTSKLIDTWRSAGISSNLFVSGVAASIAPLEKYAKGSQEATAQLVALGEEAGYQGPNNLADLNKFLGITSGALKDTAGETQKVKDIANQATVQEALLTSAMQNQGNYIASSLLGDISSAVLKYGGVANAVSAYGQALAQSGKGSTEATAAMKTAVDDIVKSELALGDNTSQMGAVVAKVFGVSMPEAMKLVDAALQNTQDTSSKTAVSIAGDFAKQAQAATSSKTALSDYTTAILNNGTSAASSKAARTQLVNDLIAAGVNSKTAQTDVTNYTNAIVNNATDTTAAKSARQQMITDVTNVGGNLKSTTTAMNNYTAQVVLNGTDSTQAKSARQQLITDLINQGVNSKTANTDVSNYTKAIQTNGTDTAAAKAARQQLITDILNASSNAKTGKTDLANYTTAVHDNGTNTDAAKTARQQLITDLKNAGINSQTATGLVNGLSKSIQEIPGGKQIGITVTGTGTWSISQGEGLQKALISGSTFNNGNAGLAAGGVLPGYAPGVDSIHAMLSPGEGVLVPEAVQAIGPDTIHMLNKHYGNGRTSTSGTAHFASGGVVSGGAGGGLHTNLSANPTFLNTQYDNTQAAMTQAVADAMTSAISTAVKSATAASAASIGMAGVTNSSAVAALQAAAAKAGWTGAQWSALESVEMREAGFSLTATNASSGAYGMAQFINGAGEYAQYGGNSTTAAGQAVAMVNYIKCMPLDGRILTRTGWKTYAQVEVGDETVGYNQATGKSAWTKVTAVHHYDEAPVTRLFSNRVDLRSTPNHRWLTEKNVQTGKTTYRREEFTETQDIGSRHRIRLAAPHDDQAGIPVSLAEAELLGWIAGDGHIGYPTPKSVNASVYQSESKPKQLAALRVLLEGIPHSEYTRPSVSGRAPIHQFRLRSPYVRDLFDRSQYEADLELMVLHMSSAQREAFTAGLLEADGYMNPKGVWTFCQNDGPVLRAFQLAAYLTGHWCHIIDSAGQKHIVLGSPYVGSGSGFHREELELQPVWCVTTELGSWTVEQSGQVFLTGNSRYGSPEAAWAHEEAYGWYKGGGIAGKLFDRGGDLAPGWNPPSYNGTGATEHLVPVRNGGPATSTTPGHAAPHTPAESEMIDLLRQLVSVTGQQGSKFAGAIQTSAGSAAMHGKYSNRRS